jgi:two-component system response regulator AtoC
MTRQNASVLVVDDERLFLVLAEEALAAEGFQVRTASTLARARGELDRGAPDVIILDRRLPDGDGIDFLRTLRAAEGDAMPLVIVVTAYGDVSNAVEALQSGAVDYLTKPIQVTDLVVKLRKVLEARGLKDRLALARAAGVRPPHVSTSSTLSREAMARLKTVSQSPLTPVLLTGPSGAGKQYAAELLHGLTYGTGDDAPFVEVNCAALPEELVESELFGHERGAFTDAKTARRGLIEMADGGTLFLDEIAELPGGSQAKLLKFLDTMKFRRLGGQREFEVRLRVVAATNQEVEASVAAGTFRADLYHRLSVFQISIPALKDRREDIPELAAAFVRYFAARIRKRIRGLTKEAERALVAYDYPGNVRELRNIIERAVIVAAGQDVADSDVLLPAKSLGRAAASNGNGFFHVPLSGDGSTPPTLEEVERQYVARVLDHMEGKRMQAAQALGVSYPTFLKRLRELGID